MVILEYLIDVCTACQVYCNYIVDYIGDAEMIAQIVSIGNSKGVRIPSALLHQYQISGVVEMLPGKDEIIIRPVACKPRQGWDSAFAAMHDQNDDVLLIDDSFDFEAWEWN